MIFCINRGALFIQFQDSQESFLRYFYITDLAHTLLPFLLFFQQLTLTADVTAITFGRNILTQGADGFTCDDLGADGCLDGDLELLTWQQLFQLFAELSAEVRAPGAVDQGAERIHFIPVQKNIHFYDIAIPLPNGMIIKGGITAGLA